MSRLPDDMQSKVYVPSKDGEIEDVVLEKVDAMPSENEDESVVEVDL